MKYYISINQVKAVEWELSSSEAIVMAWLYSFSVVADRLEYNGNTYFFANRTKALEEIPIVSDKADTIYRLYKSLGNKSLINFISIDGKDYVSITEKGKEWYNSECSERGQIRVTEKNPSDGKKIKKAEKNPIYNNIIDKERDKKERENSLKEISDSIVSYWNENTRDYSKVTKVSPNIVKAVGARLKQGLTVDDIKKAILLCNTLPDFYKGKEKGKQWKATFHWLINNTNDNMYNILNGNLHTTESQKTSYRQIIGGNGTINKMEYKPQTHMMLFWNDPSKHYVSMQDPTTMMFVDGYEDEDRPNNSEVIYNGYTYHWSKEKNIWIKRS